MEPKQVNKIFSEFIREKMERTGLNQSELARRTGVSQERISRIVNEESRISLQDFVILGSVLDADFIRELLSKIGGNRIYYVNLQTENLYELIHTVRHMQSYCFNAESCSHLFFQTPPKPKNWEALNPAPTCRFARSVSDLHQPDGVWIPLTIAKNCNTDRRNFAMQPKLAQGNCSQGLC